MKSMSSYFSYVQFLLQMIDVDACNSLYSELNRIRQDGGMIYMCGNGGSASTAMHFACDLNNAGCLDNRKFHVICLNNAFTELTATANDYGYELVFERYLEGRITSEDLLIAISGSGNSINVIRAVQQAKKAGATCVALTGFDGGNLGTIVDYHINIPSSDIRAVEDLHLTINHAIMDKLDNDFKCGDVL